MPFRYFGDFFPDLARPETRTIIVLGHSNFADDLPPDEYSFFENYCDDCDCHRVLFTVMSYERNRTEAEIAYGFEDLEFYRNWTTHEPTPGKLHELKGPVLNFGSSQSELANSLLDLTNVFVLNDLAYIERLKRHYRMFREKVGAQMEAIRVPRVDSKRKPKKLKRK